MSLPETGGSYFDADSGGPIAVAQRNAKGALNAVRSGDVGAQAAAYAIGMASIPALKYVADSFQN